MTKQFGSATPFPSLDNTEAGVLDEVVPGTVAASKAVVVDADKDYAGSRHETSSGNRLTTGGVGTVTTPATTAVEEHGDALCHVTKLTMTDFEVNATEPDNEDLAVGAKFYTLPAGAYVIENASLVGSFAKEGEATIADGEIAIGTLIGSTAVDTTGEVDATAENVCGPIVVSTGEFDGAAVFAGMLAPMLYIAATGGLARDLFLNVAATWPNVTPAGAVTFTGVITLKWRKVS